MEDLLKLAITRLMAMCSALEWFCTVGIPNNYKGTFCPEELFVTFDVMGDDFGSCKAALKEILGELPGSAAEAISYLNDKNQSIVKTLETITTEGTPQPVKGFTVKRTQ